MMAMMSRKSPCQMKIRVEDGRVVVRNQILQFAVVVREQNDRDIEPGLAHHSGELQRVHVFDVERGDDQVESPLLFCEGDRLLPARDARQFR